MSRNGNRYVSALGITLVVHDGVGGGTTEGIGRVVLVARQRHNLGPMEPCLIETGNGGDGRALHDVFHGSGADGIRRKEAEVVIVLGPVEAEEAIASGR